jgi:hypothetical protein
MPSTGMIDITMISSAGYVTASGTPAFLHGYSLQTCTEVDTVAFKDGSTGSAWVSSPKPGAIQASGTSQFAFPEGQSPWYPNGIYASFTGTRLVSVSFELSQGINV